ncbi:alpha/beta hydrolase (plasmid) [Rhodococcus pseudokoreensis]|uniref:Alpha/beta hydrolase n=1 Tax=Rhodococcus pseudokoreensis TaxID=2811421 RepID=A0A974ZR82_9NOCA|nr:alpha/beta hydrolase [Rhodococcus pseudokoreensis]
MGHTSTERECATYGAGDGTPAVFLHGWAPHRSYQRALFRLAQNGTIVYAPRLPRAVAAQSFRSIDIRRLSDYVRWLDNFLTAIGIDTPFTLVGHSVGGAIAIKAAYETPDRVAKLVLVNSLGGSRRAAVPTARLPSQLCPRAGGGSNAGTSIPRCQATSCSSTVGAQRQSYSTVELSLTSQRSGRSSSIYCSGHA